jgi:hypothetical protein
MIFYPRNTRKYPNGCQTSIDTKMTLSLECRLRLLWQAKLALRSLPACQANLNTIIAGNAYSRCRSNQLIPAYAAVKHRHPGRDCRDPEHTDVKGRKQPVPPNNRMAQKLPSMALNSSIPARMTSFGCPHILVYNDKNWSLGTSVTK